MGACIAGICGSSDGPVKPTGPLKTGVTKPVARLDEPEMLDASVDYLIERFGMQLAPPGADPPLALVSSNYRKNVQRLLVLVPTAGSKFGSWDTDLPDGRGASKPLLEWAEANDYAVALISAAALKAAPAEAWDRIISGSPSRHVIVLAATRGALEMVHAALEPVHEVLYTRIHHVVMPFEGILPPSALEEAGLASTLPVKPKALRAHLRVAQMHWPEEWADLEPYPMRQRLFEMLKEKEDAWQDQEGSKYMGLRSLKENDIPGLKRLGVQERVERLRRDRDTDELSRLIGKHQQDKGFTAAETTANEDEEEPGVD